MIEYFAFIIFANRLLFAYHTYHKVADDFAQDNYLIKMCQNADFKQLGRHVNFCTGVDLRMKTGILHTVAKEVIDDTMYNTVSINQIISLVTLFLAICLISSIHNRYVKSNNMHLPSINSQNAKQSGKLLC